MFSHATVGVGSGRVNCWRDQKSVPNPAVGQGIELFTAPQAQRSTAVEEKRYVAAEPGCDRVQLCRWQVFPCKDRQGEQHGGGVG